MTEKHTEETVEEVITDDAATNTTDTETTTEPVDDNVTDPIVDLEAKVADLEDQVLRAQAETQNIQQRNARENAAFRKYEGQKLATALLPAIDNLERALAVEANDDVAQQIKKGVEMTLTTLKQALTDQGITATGETGEAFDPTKHQAIQSVEAADAESDTIVDVLQKGYVLHDRVLRPAMVSVSQ